MLILKRYETSRYEKTNIKIELTNHSLSVISLNGNRINSPFIRKRLTECIFKNPTYFNLKTKYNFQLSTKDSF
jgi:hypothetical protein